MNTLDQAQELEQKATTLRNNGKAKEAIKIYQDAKKLYLQAGKLVEAAGMQHMIGVCYKIENNLNDAMPAYELAAKDYEKAGDALGPGRVERDIAVMYEYHDRLDEAEGHLFKSKAALEALPEGTPNPSVNEATTRNAELGITLSKIGLLYARMDKLEEAEKYMLDGITLIRKAGHPFYEMTALVSLGAVYFATQHYGRMLANVEAALGLIYEHGMYESQTRRLAQIYGLMAHGYLGSGHKASAAHFAKKSLDIISSFEADVQSPLRKDVQADKLEELLKQ